MEAVWIALIVAGGALLTAMLNGWQIRRGKREDYARQDEVAAKAEARDLAAKQRQDEVAAQAAEAATLLLAANERVATQTAQDAGETQGQLRQIHDLVNSNLTAALRAEYEAVKQQLVLLRELAALRTEFGQPASKQAEVDIRAIQSRIDELGMNLNDRVDATRVADEAVRPT